MPKTSVASLKTELIRERRISKGLRQVIDELREGVRANKKELSTQFTRLGQLQQEVDMLKAQIKRM